MMVIAGSIGIDVKSAETSYEVILSPGCSIISLTCCTKSPVFLMWCGDFPTKGLRILDNSLGTSYFIEPLLENIGLRGMFVL